MPADASIAELPPILASLAEQAEAVAKGHPGLPEGHDAIPNGQKAAWRRVLVGLAKGEGIEEWVIEPVARGLGRAGLDAAPVLRFFATQGVDELRHRDLFLAYLDRHWPAEPVPQLASHKLVYDGLFRFVIRQSEAHPLRLLLPLLTYEKTVSHYLTRLMAVADAGMPRLAAVMKEIRQDEARHVAGVGMTCRALVAKQPPGAAERAVLAALVRLVVWDMDRAAWWKSGLAAHMDALGLDALAMRRENELVYQEMIAIVEGRA